MLRLSRGQRGENPGIRRLCAQDAEWRHFSDFHCKRLAQGIGVEKTFPMHSPKVDKIEVVKKGRVRRAKLKLHA